ncbi:MAG TPA: Gfo/Idh/MocA family oxidoreductase [Candidatus Ornithomonoglobus intestinigallinarum]|uniref:Gfo/Idh/MocA family oxidoreductase n=1 Tax=Candidatus Ornithomonoglobus intestinigallinarum TaxID=2840894 RepID=A0A9D1H354_9FIRM|nr:Gfo/Idh/MocA family oxidoreductase [Candidatus Ornithomonoglobus intestinigallinarum]
MKQSTAIVIGCGQRGTAYADYVIENGDKLKITAIADPHDGRREYAKNRYNVEDANVFKDWREIAALPKMADFVIIATQDNMHYEPALAFIEKGYDLLLEKPMAPTVRECREITEAAEKKGVKVVVCHVLRFTNFWRKLKDIIKNGDIGDIVTVVHMENVGNTHQSHSYVRGNWRKTAESTPMLLAKSCHDIDILQWLIGKECRRAQSFGSLVYFVPKNRPAGAPDYCMDGCPAAEECFYHAKKLYYDDKQSWFRAIAAEKADPTDDEVMAAIKHGPYGRCVFACDNDVVDHQVVNLEYEDGVTASFTMNAFNEGGRYIRIFGTKGEIYGDMEHETIDLFSFGTRKHTIFDLEKIKGDITGGHGGGDTGIMEDALNYFAGEQTTDSICDVRTSYLNHVTAFAAEESRLQGNVADVAEFEKNN